MAGYASTNMAKPFRITSTAQVGRANDGKFTRLVADAPPKVLGSTVEKGIPLNAAIRAAAVPDRETGKGAPQNVAGPGSPAKAPVFPDAIPWPKAGPVNDANRKPFKGV